MDLPVVGTKVGLAIMKPVGQLVLYKAKLRMLKCSYSIHRCLLPTEYWQQETFPIIATPTPSLAVGLTQSYKSLYCVCLRAKNKGFKDAAESCEIIPYLTGPMGFTPITAYWTTGDRTFATIPSLDTREFVVFLIDAEKDELIFCSSVYPSVSLGAPLWQLTLPFPVLFHLVVQLQSTTARSTTVEFDVSVSGKEKGKIHVRNWKRVNPTKNNMSPFES